MAKFVEVVNLPKKVCNHVMGKQHTRFHRRACGIVFMIAGVYIAEELGGLAGGIHGLPFLLNLIGYAIHGTGLTPFIEED